MLPRAPRTHRAASPARPAGLPITAQRIPEARGARGARGGPVPGRSGSGGSRGPCLLSDGVQRSPKANKTKHPPPRKTSPSADFGNIARTVWLLPVPGQAQPGFGLLLFNHALLLALACTFPFSFLPPITTWPLFCWRLSPPEVEGLAKAGQRQGEACSAALPVRVRGSSVAASGSGLSAAWPPPLSVWRSDSAGEAAGPL